MYAKDQRHGSRCRERRRKKKVLLITAKNARAGGERAERIRKVATVKLERVLYAVLRIFDCLS